jgi:hypothetical protein
MEAGYSSALVITNKSISDQAVKHQLGGKFIPTLLSSGTRSWFSSRFLAALLLGHSSCQEEDQIPVFLIHLGKQAHHFLHQQRPGSR